MDESIIVKVLNGRYKDYKKKGSIIVFETGDENVPYIYYRIMQVGFLASETLHEFSAILELPQKIQRKISCKIKIDGILNKRIVVEADEYFKNSIPLDILNYIRVINPETFIIKSLNKNEENKLIIIIRKYIPRGISFSKNIRNMYDAILNISKNIRGLLK